MTDALDIINKTIEEHRLIHENISNVSDRANDVNAHVLLDWERADLAVSSAESIEARIANLQKSVSSLQKNLGRHFGFEEMYLPPVLGTELMNTLLTDHTAIRGRLDKAAQQLSAFKSEGASPKELVYKKMQLIGIINDLTDMIKAHALKEDTILRSKKSELENLK